MQQSDRLTNYLLWIQERGLTVPIQRPWSEERSPSSDGEEDWQHCTSCSLAAYRTAESRNSFGGRHPVILFVGDGGSAVPDDATGPVPDTEETLIRNIAKALSLSEEQYHYLNYFKCPAKEFPAADNHALKCREHFVASIRKLDPRGVVLLGSQTLNFVSGKRLDFSSLRGKVFTPELYGVPTVVTYHMRDMLRFPENKSLVWTDLNLLKEQLD